MVLRKNPEYPLMPGWSGPIIPREKSASGAKHYERDGLSVRPQPTRPVGPNRGRSKRGSSACPTAGITSSSSVARPCGCESSRHDPPCGGCQNRSRGNRPRWRASCHDRRTSYFPPGLSRGCHAHRRTARERRTADRNGAGCLDSRRPLALFRPSHIRKIPIGSDWSFERRGR